MGEKLHLSIDVTFSTLICIFTWKAKTNHLSFFFAACGFLEVYHLGAAYALSKHGKKLLEVVTAFAGASSGSVTATVLLTVPENIEECTKNTYEFAEDPRKLHFGPLTPSYDILFFCRGCIDSILPPNAHEIAENRLFVSVTSAKNEKNHLLSNSASREDLVKNQDPGAPLEQESSTDLVTVRKTGVGQTREANNKKRQNRRRELNLPHWNVYSLLVPGLEDWIRELRKTPPGSFPTKPGEDGIANQEGYDDAIHFSTKGKLV
ncbi:LOW QUALITY PROTEIN: patatin-like phospholipase domain-containing protein 4 [Podarcis raffonei]|uniref:LOW QUALITY PROTEIN: patatin-like phospholipase domain-containing protein 4 n=1 Tax=Podarcis raffonei TaxID=65483 RepID=UPI0023298C4B|nr:LOW QUALITY PROTEIN: patatin-like phospholipase domain-containing protein 4 [Podarcis raffonei]